MILNFSIDSEPQYTLQCINLSATSWYFYVYQRTAGQSSKYIFYLVWMISPFRIGFSSYVIFKWSESICFAWLYTGLLQAGVSPNTGGTASVIKNGTTFDIEDSTPQFLNFVPYVPSDEFSIKGGTAIPNNVFSTGIGMSGFGILVQQSYINVVQGFTAATTYWVAATNNYMQASDVLDQNTISNSISFTFPLNVYDRTATFGDDNLWSIT